MKDLFLNVMAEKEKRVEIGSLAPDFVLNDEKGKEWRLSEQRENVTALLFYPQNETLVCTKQLCELRDNWSDYMATKAVIVGISPGNSDEHQRFSERYRLPLPILADTDRAVTKLYSHNWLMPDWLTRAIIIVDAKGIIRSRKVMLRAFRPTDYQVISAIYRARSEALNDKYNSIVKSRLEKKPE